MFKTNYYQMYAIQLLKMGIDPMTKKEWDQLQDMGQEIEAMYKLKHELIDKVIK